MKQLPAAATVTGIKPFIGPVNVSDLRLTVKKSLGAKVEIPIQQPTEEKHIPMFLYVCLALG